MQPASVPYGATPAVAADVTQTGGGSEPGGSVAFTFDGLTVTAPVTGGQAKATQGTAVTGQVKFVLKRDGVKIRKALVEVNAVGKAKHVFRNIAKPGNYTLVAKYLGSATLERSTDKVKLVV